jgi:phosphatidylserine/phosphatidylglycerophosphate/cardiolipin synthase-like enzyme
VADIRAHWNCDHTFVVWRYPHRIEGCRGFALERRDSNGKVTPVHTWVGWDRQVADVGSVQRSTDWPIQRFSWADFQVAPGDTLSYRVVPMVGTAADLHADESQASGWSDPVTVTASARDGMSAYFNRGIVSTQWLSRALGGGDEKSQQQQLETVIATPGNVTRDRLGGELKRALLELLDAAAADGKTVYAALFELNDPELIDRLVKLADRARVILANGATKHAGEDENDKARKQLRDAGVQVHDRMLSSGHLGHNKFVVVCDVDGRDAETAVTGSTNWSKTGLCTQANNALVLDDPAVARLYRDQWDRLAAAGGGYPPELIAANDEEKTAAPGASHLSVWFTPVEELVDLDEAKRLIDAAKDGILFLMFNPGPRGTLLNDIIERNSAGSPAYDPDLYIHGVLNQDPSTTKNPVIGLFRRGHFEPANFDVVLPAHIDARLDYWTPEIQKLPEAFAMVHSKTVVIDPFGEEPVVMTGSHNLGPKASSSNDDNLVIVRGSHALAAAYAVNIIGIYTQYRWRFLRARKEAGEQPAAQPGRRFARREWDGLQDDDRWQDQYFAGPRLREQQFWLGTPVAAPVGG